MQKSGDWRCLLKGLELLPLANAIHAAASALTISNRVLMTMLLQAALFWKYYLASATDPQNIRLRIRQDGASGDYLSSGFHSALRREKKYPATAGIENAAAQPSKGGWED